MKIGLVSLWFARGQSYVAKNVISALEGAGHEVFLMARAGYVHGEKHLQNTGEWKREGMSTYPDYKIPEEIFDVWLKEKKLDAVVFVEEQWQTEPLLAAVAKDNGCRVINVVMREAYNRGELQYYDLCDAIICPTKNAHDYVKCDFPRTAYHVKWGIDFDEFDTAKVSVKRTVTEDIRFFHPGGWGGVSNRRGTPDAIAAFKAACADTSMTHATMLVTAQKNIESLHMADLTGKIKMLFGTVEREKLLSYFLYSDVAVLPSMWEGLGLTFLESLASGLAIITTKAGPMDEFVKHEENGLLLPAMAAIQLPNIHTPAHEPNIKAYAGAIARLAEDKELVEKMKAKSLEIARDEWDWKKNGQRLVDIVEGAVA